MRILVVDDDAISRKMLEKLLMPYGEIDTAVNGRDAIATFHLAITQGRPFDLVCLDIVMPEMDGHEALMKMRDMDNEQWVRPKIIMTTAFTDSDNVKKAFLKHCDAYIAKPISQEVLIGKLRSLGLVKMKTLIIEDGFITRFLLQRFSELYGEVHTAVNARDALTLFHQAIIQEKPYDLVYIGAKVSGMTGHEILTAIRHLEDDQIHSKAIMIVLPTELEDVKQADLGYCDAYITKPVTREGLINELRSIKML